MSLECMVEPSSIGREQYRIIPEAPWARNSPHHTAWSRERETLCEQRSFKSHTTLTGVERGRRTTRLV